jgi:hypothetical protein
MNPNDNQVIDALLKRMAQNPHSCNIPIHLNDLYGSEFGEAHHIYFFKMLLEHNLGEKSNYKAGRDLTITLKGEHIVRNGGWLAQVEMQELEAQAQKIRERDELENLKWNTLVNKSLYKTRWLPHVLAAIAVAISLITLFQVKLTSFFLN